ncbi:hypothetical protein D3C85_844310 [compost metagenome]
MTTVATDTARVSNLVKHELWPETGFCRKVVTVNEATAKTYAVGTVLGKVTADGKYKIAVQTAVDGSQTAAAIVIDDYSIAATTDTKVLVLIKGPAEVSQDALVLDASYDQQAEKDAVYASLEALNINVLTTV